MLLVFGKIRLKMAYQNNSESLRKTTPDFPQTKKEMQMFMAKSVDSQVL